MCFKITMIKSKENYSTKRLAEVEIKILERNIDCTLMPLRHNIITINK